MSVNKVGHVVWHDLFTPNVRAAMAFYERVANWTYVAEHASEFVWGGGERDFVLALLHEEAGAGILETPNEMEDGWVPYVEAADVDAVAALAAKLGGAVIRSPFDVPGVGRNCLLRDPVGAHFGVSLSRHDFPTPTTQFGDEYYLSATSSFPAEFYAQLFGWAIEDQSRRQPATAISTSDGDIVAYLSTPRSGERAQARWIPRIKVSDVAATGREVIASGGDCVTPHKDIQQIGPYDVLKDPYNALFSLVSKGD